MIEISVQVDTKARVLRGDVPRVTLVLAPEAIRSGCSTILVTIYMHIYLCIEHCIIYI